MGELVNLLNTAGGAFVAWAGPMLIQSSVLIVILAASGSPPAETGQGRRAVLDLAAGPGEAPSAAGLFGPHRPRVLGERQAARVAGAGRAGRTRAADSIAARRRVCRRLDAPDCGLGASGWGRIQGACASQRRAQGAHVTGHRTERTDHLASPRSACLGGGRRWDGRCPDPTRPVCARPGGTIP